MNIPFTSNEFFDVFRSYNEAIWPAQIVLNLIAFGAVLLAFRPQRNDRLISSGLALLWLWTGAVYHLFFFTSINPAAYVFGGACIVQSALFLWRGVVKNRLTYTPVSNPAGWLGGLFVFYGLIGYPVLGYFLGHSYPQSPTFGAPCPTTIFTFGMLLWTGRSLPLYVLIIPAVWSLVGVTAAFKFGVMEDFGLLVAGITATALITVHKRASNGKAVPSA